MRFGNTPDQAPTAPRSTASRGPTHDSGYKRLYSHVLAENVESWTDQWKREGLEQGRDETRHPLTRLASRRFGPAIATRAEPLLAAIHAPQPLEELGEQLLTCADGEAWLNAIQSKR